MDQNCLAAVTAISLLVGAPAGILFRALLKAQAEIIASQAATIKTLNEDARAMMDRLDRFANVNERQIATNESLIQKTTNSRRS